MQRPLAIAAFALLLPACGAEEEPSPAAVFVEELAPTPRTGEATGSGRAIDENHPGHLAYRRYCASCHGLFADGRGPVASALAAPPPDLTRLAERLGSPLERDTVIATIDGRRTVRAHGQSDMPVWGDVMLVETPEVPEKEWAKTAILRSIADYLIAIQSDDPATR